METDATILEVTQNSFGDWEVNGFYTALSDSTVETVDAKIKSIEGWLTRLNAVRDHLQELKKKEQEQKEHALIDPIAQAIRAAHFNGDMEHRLSWDNLYGYRKDEYRRAAREALESV